jgi:glutathione S-transferase
MSQKIPSKALSTTSLILFFILSFLLVQLRQKGYEALGVMENQLGRTPFLAGDRFTVADIALHAYTHVAQDAGFELERFQNVRSWLSRVESVPGFHGMAKACR